MTYPFPGMNPWLEQPGLWENFHNSLIVAIRDELNRLIRPHYWASIEERVYVMSPDENFVGQLDIGVMSSLQTTTPLQTTTATPAAEPVLVEIPEAKVVELYLEIRKPQSAEVVTAIEVLSPPNKRAGEGRLVYERKRRAILHSQTHLIEIDFLRGNEPLFFQPKRRSHAHDYGILISRSSERPDGQFYPFSLRDPIPPFVVPLLFGDKEPTLDLNPVVRDVYQRAAFDLAINYARPPIPPHTTEDAEWAKHLLNL